MLETLKPASFSQESISIRQTGGVDECDNPIEVHPSDPLMRAGDKAILFLIIRQEQVNTCYVYGGPQTRFIVRNEQVFAIDSDAPTFRNVNGQPLDEFLSMVRSYVGSAVSTKTGVSVKLRTG